MANTLTGVNLPTYQISSTAGGGGSGQILTTAGINGTSWTNTTVSSPLIVSNDPASLEVKGKIIHNGIDLEERLKTIEKVLMIPERDVKLEKKYPKLKKIYDEYIKELSKARMWESIKGEGND